MMIALFTFALGFLLLAGCTIVRQEHLIYMPRVYEDHERLRFEHDGYVPLTFTTSEGKQMAYWKPASSATPSDPSPPLWMVFSGNGGCAMDYTDLAIAAPRAWEWLFVDYPSYGDCQGSPNPSTIRANALGALDALARRLETSRESLLPRLGTFGHSIGGAVALDVAADLQLQRCVVVSTFTSMKAMAARVITPLLTPFLRHRFDNEAALERLSHQSPLPRVTILHGAADSIIPSSMGARLAQSQPDFTTFVSVTGAGHNDIIDLARKDIVAALESVSAMPTRNGNP